MIVFYCPVCRQRAAGGAVLYQVSYPGQRGYVSPRCSECYDKMMAKRTGAGPTSWAEVKRQYQSYFPRA